MFEVFDRSGTGSSKWARAGEGRIAMGLADMDLPGPPAIATALAARARHPAYGYTVCDPRGREIVADWYRRRHGVEVDPDWVMLLPFSPRTALRLLLECARPVGPVVFGSPEWGGFGQLCRAAGLPHHEVPLERTPEGYRLPLAEFGRHRPGVLLLSSPHNPSGRLWPRADIRALAELAAGTDGLLISDEVHSDLVHPDTTARHPVAVDAADELRNHTVTLHSVGKTFNTSGIPSCYALIPDAGLRHRLTERMAGYGLWEGGLLEQTVQHAALTHSDEWLDQLLPYLAVARDLAVTGLGAAVVARPQASYLLWLDGTALGSRERILRERGVELSGGSDFGGAAVSDFGVAEMRYLRLNFALPLPLLRTAITRLTCAEPR